jgi:predicted AAA+ superfamily ATPase
MIKRELEAGVRKLAGQFKAVAITGPRQSGKTTLARAVFADKAYVSLEAPDERERAIRDPRQFLSRFAEGCVLDEVQRAPQLFSYLQEELDRSADPGRYILTGSQQFGMMEQITQSLAGRIGMATLLPFSISELEQGGYRGEHLNQVLWKGAYPPIFDQGIEPDLWLDSYITTYIERDVRQIVNIQDTLAFQRFLSLCAGSVGQLFNASRIGNDCGLNHGTVTKWLSILEASYIAYRLPPHHRNFRKRLVKTPKLYFWDTGLVCRLLGIEHPDQLATHPLRGAVFENWAVTELMKGRCNRLLKSNLYFWRNNTGMEVDVLAEKSGKLMPVEIKSGSTIGSDWTTGLERWLELAGEEAIEPGLIYGGDTKWKDHGVEILPWKSVSSLAKRL